MSEDYLEIARNLAQRMQLEMQKPLRRSNYTTTAVASGNTLRSTQVRVFTNQDGVRILIFSSEYWKFSNYGRRPGLMPPVHRIEKWIKEKRLTLNPWAVAKSIAKKGTNKPAAMWAEKSDIDVTIKEIERAAVGKTLAIIKYLRK